MTTSSKLNPAFKNLWLDALESGRFSHAQGALKSNLNDPDNPGQYLKDTNGACCMGHCCLGVAAVLMKEHNLLPLRTDVNDNGVNLMITGDAAGPSMGLLPKSLRDQINLTQDDMYELYRLNDSPDTHSYVPVIAYIKERL